MTLRDLYTLPSTGGKKLQSGVSELTRKCWMMSLLYLDPGASNYSEIHLMWAAVLVLQ
jgi:hypothetical protein